MITFKGGWGKLYYIQHTLLSNVGQLPFFFFRNKHTHTWVRKMDSNTKAHHKINQLGRSSIITNKEEKNE